MIRLLNRVNQAWGNVENLLPRVCSATDYRFIDTFLVRWKKTDDWVFGCSNSFV